MFRSINVLAVLCLLAGCSGDDISSNNNGQNGIGMMQNSRGSNLSVTDRQFIQNAAVGGMFEVQAGQIAADRATNGDLKHFAQQMMNDHQRMNTELMQLAQQKGANPPTELDMDARSQIDTLNSLNGADFDQVYITGQVKAHTDTISFFQSEANNGQDPGVKAFASRNLPMLQHHLEMIKNLQSSIGMTGLPETERRGPGMPNNPVVPPDAPSGNQQPLPPQNPQQ
jgi:putative membrane protein